MTYTELSNAIKAYCESAFPESSAAVGFTSEQQINSFITSAEQLIYNKIQFPSVRKNVTGLMTAGSPYLSAPADFLSCYSLMVIDSDTGRYEPLLNKDVNFIRVAFPNPSTLGKPEYYALFGPATTTTLPTVITTELAFILGPTPDLPYTAELHYNSYPESITVSASGTSWLGDNFDTVLLYGSLVRAGVFMKLSEEELRRYTGLYDEALIGAKRLGDGLERRDAYRVGQATVEVK